MKLSHETHRVSLVRNMVCLVMYTKKGLRLAVVTARTDTQLPTSCKLVPAHHVLNLAWLCICTHYVEQIHAVSVGECLHLWSVCSPESITIQSPSLVWMTDKSLLACITLHTHPLGTVLYGLVHIWAKAPVPTFDPESQGNFSGRLFDACRLFHHCSTSTSLICTILLIT